MGRDDSRTTWNYAQPAYRTPGRPLQLAWRGAQPNRSLTTWKIGFHSRGYSQGRCTLDIALASLVFGALTVALNGVEVANFDPWPGPPGDSSAYRPGDRGRHRQLPSVVFPANLVRPGVNVITLSSGQSSDPPPAPGGRTNDRTERPGAARYDVIRLGVDEKARWPRRAG